MSRQLDFYQALLDAGVPCDGVSGTGPTCRIDFQPSATQAQRNAAKAARSTFDWAEPTPVKPRANLKSMLDSAAAQTPEGQAAIRDMTQQMLIDWIISNPDKARTIASAYGFVFNPRT